MTPTALRAAVSRFPSAPLLAGPSLVHPLPRLSASLGGARLLIKRDDAIAFGFGGNKVRKLALVAAKARAEGADTLITAGGTQSNHARATAAAAAALGLRAVLVLNGVPPPRATANALLDELLGADVIYVPTREERALRMEQAADELMRAGRHPFVIPIGASTPLGALAFTLAVAELVDQGVTPDVIVHASSSGGTQAGLQAGCRLLGLPTRVIGVSADESADALASVVRDLVGGVADLLDVNRYMLEEGPRVEVDDRFVGDGYGIPTDASREALHLAARTDAIFLDPTYTAKAMAGLISYVREGRFAANQTVLFWHTGGQVGLFA